jgi:sugar (pentulose or hexulose) kinase
VGGGARSALWRQLKADICQIPWRVPQVTEAVAQTIRFTQRIELQPDLAKL